MRLINTTTLLFEEFLGKNIPKYAILSHTWGEQEVSFKDMETNAATTKIGFQKIQMTCQLARSRGHRYAWIDTCCIDKLSSAELSEAINSMYRWYQRAEICFVHLFDLPAGVPLKQALPKCRWLRRGWTLQELIAPRIVHFFDQQWVLRESKVEIADQLSELTGIPTGVLTHEAPLSSMAVAARMSWAAHRECTRIEDRAYSLLGIFGLNMPLLYGEEENAFRRLQEEIIRSINDLSILAWTLSPNESGVHESRPRKRRFCVVLATSPEAFSGCRAFLRDPNISGRETSISSVGIKTKALMYIILNHQTGKWQYVLPLDCWDTNGFVTIRLKKCGLDQFLREDSGSLLKFSASLAEVPAMPISERYLLTQLPGSWGRLEGTASISSLSLADTRPFALQLKGPTEMNYASMWSIGQFDVDDMAFFVNHEVKLDYAIANLVFEFDGSKSSTPSSSRFYCTFIALGWSNGPSRRSGFQCSLVEFSTCRDRMISLQFEMARTEYTSQVLARQLVDYKIPKQRKAIFLLPDTKKKLVISFTEKRCRNPEICISDYWGIDFSCTTGVAASKKDPEQQWDLGLSDTEADLNFALRSRLYLVTSN